MRALDGHRAVRYVNGRAEPPEHLAPVEGARAACGSWVPLRTYDSLLIGWALPEGGTLDDTVRLTVLLCDGCGELRAARTEVVT